MGVAEEIELRQSNESAVNTAIVGLLGVDAIEDLPGPDYRSALYAPCPWAWRSGASQREYAAHSSAASLPESFDSCRAQTRQRHRCNSHTSIACSNVGARVAKSYRSAQVQNPWAFPSCIRLSSTAMSRGTTCTIDGTRALVSLSYPRVLSEGGKKRHSSLVCRLGTDASQVY